MTVRALSKADEFASLFKDEAHLRKALIGLLERMPGTSNVRHTHGVNERGKDALFDQSGPFGQTQTIACVVKNDKITGSADSNSGARNVFNQAEQALALPFIDSQGTELRISQVFVISPADCSTSAVESIRDKLLNNRGRVSFICGPALLDLFEKYYPDFLLFQSGLFGSYVAALEREFDNDEPISNVLFRSGIPAEARALQAVYVRPSFYQVFHTFKRTVSVPDLSVLNSPVQEEVVSEFRQALRRLGDSLRHPQLHLPKGRSCSAISRGTRMISRTVGETHLRGVVRGVI